MNVLNFILAIILFFVVFKKPKNIKNIVISNEGKLLLSIVIIYLVVQHGKYTGLIASLIFITLLNEDVLEDFNTKCDPFTRDENPDSCNALNDSIKSGRFIGRTKEEKISLLNECCDMDSKGNYNNKHSSGKKPHRRHGNSSSNNGRKHFDKWSRNHDDLTPRQAAKFDSEFNRVWNNIRRNSNKSKRKKQKGCEINDYRDYYSTDDEYDSGSNSDTDSGSDSDSSSGTSSDSSSDSSSSYDSDDGNRRQKNAMFDNVVVKHLLMPKNSKHNGSCNPGDSPYPIRKEKNNKKLGPNKKSESS